MNRDGDEEDDVAHNSGDDNVQGDEGKAEEHEPSAHDNGRAAGRGRVSNVEA